MMPRLFLSYAHPDHAGRNQVAAILMSLGFDVWWDKELRAGQHIDAEIERSIRLSDGFAALWSAAYVRAGGYTEKEFRFATLTLRKPTAIILLEPVRPVDLSLTMSGLLLPRQPLSTLGDPADAAAVVANAVLDAGLRIPQPLPSAHDVKVDYSSKAISPEFDRLVSLAKGEVRSEIERQHRILSGNPDQAFHCINTALLWMYLGDHSQAASLAQRAIAARPDHGEIAYYAALVAASMTGFACGPLERIDAIWKLTDNAISCGFDMAMPYLLRAALAVDYFDGNGLRSRGDAATQLAMARKKPADPGEMRRLMAILGRTAPQFCRRVEVTI
jgi:hypothetical protein